MRAWFVLPLILLPLPAMAQSAQEIGERLDMTSFPNSIEREDSTYTLIDYGFTKVEFDGGTVLFLEPDESWLFAITPLDTFGNIMVCIEDKAQNGGSYDVVQALEVIKGDDGLLHATAADVSHPDCEERE